MNYRNVAAFAFTLALTSMAAAQTDSAAKAGDSSIMDNTLQVTGAVVSADANRLVVKTTTARRGLIITDKQVNGRIEIG
jgi:hypothetical protein